MLAAKGKDILCAAVSVLTENLSHSLQVLLNLPVEIQAEKGLYKTNIGPEHVSDASNLLFASTVLGLRVLAKQFPERLEIKEKIYGT